jgi:hypothetical protein
MPVQAAAQGKLRVRARDGAVRSVKIVALAQSRSPYSCPARVAKPQIMRQINLAWATSAGPVAGAQLAVLQLRDRGGEGVADHAVTRRRVVHVGRIVEQVSPL